MQVRFASLEEQVCLKFVFFFGLFLLFVWPFTLPLFFFLSFSVLFPCFFFSFLSLLFLCRLVDFLFFLFCPSWTFAPLWLIRSAPISRLSLWTPTLVLFSAVTPSLFYDGKLTPPILTHLRRRWSKRQEGEGRTLPWGEQVWTGCWLECFLVFQFTFQLDLSIKIFPITYDTNRQIVI